MAKAFSTGDTVSIQGLRELTQALRQVDTELPKALREASVEAAELVATDARGRASSMHGAARKTAPSIKAMGTQRQAVVRLGHGGRYPFALGAEFGALQYKQFPAWTGNGMDAGYFFFPAIRDNTDKVVELMADRLERVTRHAFPE